jgi:hypothetical protein
LNVHLFNLSQRSSGVKTIPVMAPPNHTLWLPGLQSFNPAASTSAMCRGWHSERCSS